jgi:hypothetical protein
VWFAHTDEYTLYRRTLEGDTLLATSIPSRPASVPVAEIDSLLRLMSQIPGRGEVGRADFVPVRRLVTRVLTDGAGRVYVLPEEEGVPEGSVVDVFEGAGVYLGRMSFGARVLTIFPATHVTPTHVYAVVPDELDVPFVVRWRIVRP